MDNSLLQELGLTKPQAAAYQALVQSGGATAPHIAAQIAESRSNTYKVLDRLCELGLATKDQQTKQIRYYPASPAALEQLLHQQAAAIDIRTRKLNAALPGLLDYYFAYAERPSIRYFQGKEGLEQIYRDEVVTGQTIHYIRAPDDVHYIGHDELHHLRNLFPRVGIRRVALTQDIPLNLPESRPTIPMAESDKAMLLERTWITKDDYNAPVEWAAYGNKLAIVSYGQEAMGMIIESEQIAGAFRQLFALLDEGIRRRPTYHLHPIYATHTVLPESQEDSKGKPR